MSLGESSCFGYFFAFSISLDMLSLYIYCIFFLNCSGVRYIDRSPPLPENCVKIVLEKKYSLWGGIIFGRGEKIPKKFKNVFLFYIDVESGST